MSEDCVFCAIVDGELPSYDVHETDEVLAFLDANPLAAGHTLVVPKAHREQFTDLDGEETAAVFNAAREVAPAVVEAVDADGFNLYQTNGAAADQEVFHSHVHVLPRFEDDDVGLTVAPGDLDEDRAEAVQADIRDAL